MSIASTFVNVFPRFPDRKLSPSLQKRFIYIVTVIPSDVADSLILALLNGLNDYTIDERGDVGSWIRLVSIQGLTALCKRLFTHAVDIPDFHAYFPPGLYVAIVSGILKQGVERLDNVRQEAGKCFLSLLDIKLPCFDGAELWQLPGRPLLEELFQTYVSVYFAVFSDRGNSQHHQVEVNPMTGPTASGYSLEWSSSWESRRTGRIS